MKKHKYIYSRANNERMDIYLESILNISRSQIKKRNNDDMIYVNGKKVKAGYLLSEGDSIEVFEEDPYHIHPIDLNLKILYEDDQFAVIEKSAGLVVHPGAGKEEITLVHGLLHAFECLSEGSGPERPGIVHRLDKDTSGLMIITKTNQSYDAFVKMFKERRIKKNYYCIVSGNIPNKGSIARPIGRNHVNRMKMAIDVTPSKEAYTEYRPLYNFSHYTLLDVNILTGRTHQIRVHMSSIGHPVIGDGVYGANKERLSRHLLHSYKLSFIHPWKDEKVEFESRLPKDFLDFITNKGGKDALNFRRNIYKKNDF